MKCGVMQSYFFPYVGYYSLIEYVDRFVFFDTSQYIRHGWVNRNRILNQEGEPTYIIVPVKKGHRSTPINRTLIDNEKKWTERIYGQLSVYKKAPHYVDTLNFLHEIFDNHEFEFISGLNIYCIKQVCQKIGIKAEFAIYSETDNPNYEIEAADEWALYITKTMGGDSYVNPPGGRSFFDRNKYEREKIALLFLESNLKPYVQRINRWIPSLSIIDVMMFCDEREIKDIIHDYRVTED